MGKRPCTWLWDMVIINERGDVLICTNGQAEQLKLGNLEDDNLAHIVSGERMKQIRIAHLLHDFTNLPMCEQCGDRLIYKNFDVEFFKRYLLDLGREDLIPRMVENFQND